MTLQQLKQEASVLATSKDFEGYTQVRTAMDEILRDEAFHTKQLSAAVEAGLDVSSLHEEELPKLTPQAERSAQITYQLDVRRLDIEHQVTDKKAAQKLKLKISVPGGVSDKFYNPVSPVTKHPESFDLKTVPVADIKPGDFIGAGEIVSASRGVGTLNGKTDVVYKKLDGSVVQNSWWSTTEVRVHRQKASVAV